jgi:hypothetical protein
LTDHPDKVRIKFDRTEPMIVFDRLPVGVHCAPIEETVEMKRHHIVTIEGFPHAVLRVLHWLEKNVQTGEIDTKAVNLVGDTGFRRLALRHDVPFRSVSNVVASYGADPSFGGAMLDGMKIIWSFGSDDDVFLLRLRWEGAVK